MNNNDNENAAHQERKKNVDDNDRRRENQAEMNEERDRAEKIIQNKTCVQNKRKTQRERAYRIFFFVVFFFCKLVL